MGSYVKRIEQNTIDSHQSSPGYVLTCLRWDNRDTFNYSGDPLDVRQPLVIINDAIDVSVSNSKKGLTSSMAATLKGGDLNYATTLNPGDFILVNLLNWEEDVWRVATKARNLQQINKHGDGFKGVFKIQSVQKSISVSNGIKSVSYTIHANGFTEFANVMMYNPAIVAAFREKGANFYATAIGEFYNDKLKANAGCQGIVRDLFKILIGKSRKDSTVKVKNYGNTHFKVPKSLGKLLGREASHATDIFNYIVGIWKGANSGLSTNLAKGMNPNITNLKAEGPNHYETGTPIQGNKQVFVENWNNNQAWSIIQQNTNSVMNELFTTYRIDINGAVMPTVICRQKPFTTEHFKAPAGMPVTRFFELPRWRVSSNLLLNATLGKNEAARFNFVQVFTRALADTEQQDMAEQIARENFKSDNGDISRNGLKPYVVTSNFDFPISNGKKDEGKKTRAKEWANIVSDWIIDGHNKVSGTLKFVGLQDPISVGDNLEFDGIILHIESITHNVRMLGDKKTFRTTVQVSYGMDARSSKLRPVYAESDHTDAHTEKIEDEQHENILPGIGNTQLSLGRDRTDGEELSETRQKSFTQAPKKRAKTEQSNTGEVKKPDNDSGEK